MHPYSLTKKEGHPPNHYEKKASRKKNSKKIYSNFSLREEFMNLGDFGRGIREKTTPREEKVPSVKRTVA